MKTRAASPGARLIAAERRRQITQKRWSARHDDHHVVFELTSAAMAYATRAMMLGMRCQQDVLPPDWPRSWAAKWWKPEPRNTGDPQPIILRKDAIRMLVKAGALLAAEIDRLRRLKEP